MTELAHSLPNFFVIGAPKAGSATMSHYLSMHPDVFLPDKKEIDYFLDERQHARGLNYLAKRHFSGAAAHAARGDASVQYLYSACAARRIGEELPESHHRFVALLRNPADRAWSAYWWERGEGGQPGLFLQTMENEAQRLEKLRSAGERWWQYAHLGHGQYAHNLAPWLERFSAQRFCFVLFDDLREDPAQAAGRVFDFLGVDRAQAPADAVHRNRAVKARFPALARLVAHERPLKRYIRPLLPGAWSLRMGKLIRSANQVEAHYPPMDEHTRRWLNDFYRDDVLRLAGIIGRDLTAWSSP